MSTPGGTRFEPSKPGPVGEVKQGSWIGDLPPNETGVIYIKGAGGGAEAGSDAGADAGSYREVSRGAKPYIESAGYFGSLFAEEMVEYRAAAINRNESVELNLGRVRQTANATAEDLAGAVKARNEGLAQSTQQTGDMISTNLGAVGEKLKLATDGAKNLDARLSALGVADAPSGESSLAGREVLPVEVVRAATLAVDSARLVGQESLAGSAPNGLSNAADIELGEYDKLDPALRGSPGLVQGAEALRQAKYYSKTNPEMAGALYAEGRSARAFATGEIGTAQVAVWDVSAGNIAMVPVTDAANRVLPVASFFGAQRLRVESMLEDAAGGTGTNANTAAAPDSVLRTTQRIVAEATETLASDPVKSLGGLFRARTLVENIKLYGGAWAKLTKWSAGAAARLRKLFSPPPKVAYPGGAGRYIAIEVSKNLKNAVSEYQKNLQAGQYAIYGIGSVYDMFGTDELAELKTSLKDGAYAASVEAKPMEDLYTVAPTLYRLWVSNDARKANEADSKAEIAQLNQLRDLYEARVQTLLQYGDRIKALSGLATVDASALDSPLAFGYIRALCSPQTGTVCDAEVFATSEQLREVSALSDDARRETAKTVERYRRELEKLDQLIDGWLMVLPDPSVRDYRRLGPPMRDLERSFR
ncbi:hypothetical protein [Paraburkholderia sp. RAU2J]|uniref:hypothetical protein n=1 Tax=Paraburkholderia sp. RAU2J TaxID=1938810 RepID=UPI0011C3EB93|nr:hypothetical protein [Paraburkholderia sp. RAU2J]